MLTVDEMQKSIEEQIRQSPYIGGLSFHEAMQYAVNNLSEETGEVAGLLKREVMQHKEVPIERWVDEVGDVLWCIIAVATIKDISLERIWEANQEKLEGRYGNIK